MAFLLLLILTVSFPLSGTAVQQGPDATARLNAAIDEYELSEDSLPQAVIRVATEFEIPLGIEWVKGVKSEKVELHFRATTVQEIVDTVVRIQPGYGWDLRNGVLHVFAHSLRKDERNVLNLPLEEFQVEDDYVQFASRRLQRRVQQMITRPGHATPGGGEAGSWATGAGDQRVSFVVRDVTVRDVLDNLCLAADFKIWMATFPATPEPTPSGHIRPISPWSDQTSWQLTPVWFLFQWGYDPILRKPRPDWQKQAVVVSATPRP